MNKICPAWPGDQISKCRNFAIGFPQLIGDDKRARRFLILRLKGSLRKRRIYRMPGWNVATGFAIALSLAASGCKKAATVAEAPVPEVVVTDVGQRNVTVYSDWVGTTEGFVNADIYPKISGYLLKQNYKDGDHVRTSQLLFQIDDREYKAALDQAVGDLGRLVVATSTRSSAPTIPLFFERRPLIRTNPRSTSSCAIRRDDAKPVRTR